MLIVYAVTAARQKTELARRRRDSLPAVAEARARWADDWHGMPRERRAAVAYR